MMGLDFTVVPSGYEEDMTLKLAPKKLAAVLSLGKAMEVAKRENGIIIAADTFVSYGGAVIGKPKDKAHAQQMLKMLSGKIHSVFTGVTIIDTHNSKIITKVEETKLTFKKISAVEIDWYVNSGDRLGLAGAYAVQDIGSIFVKRIEGDFFNVMGLPLRLLAELLKKFNIDIFALKTKTKSLEFKSLS